jgi:adenosine kinase
MNILVTGSIAYDLLLQYDGSFADAIDGQDIERLSVSFFSPHYARHHGGTGANIAWNLALLKQSPLLVGTVGGDGAEYIALLKKRGVDVSHVEKLGDFPTATAIIGTDSGERQIAFFHPGADAKGTFPDLTNEPDIGAAIVSARDAGLMLQGVRQCQHLSIPYLFDPGQQVIAMSADELFASAKSSAGIVCNGYEWDLFQTRLSLPIEGLLEEVPIAIVTEGEEGVTLYTAEKTIRLPACKPDRVVNPTGAGDAFRAGVLTGIANGWSLKEGVMLGQALASFVVEIEGTLIEKIDLDAVWGRAETTYGENLPALT